jgi:hypothetical protein
MIKTKSAREGALRTTTQQFAGKSVAPFPTVAPAKKFDKLGRDRTLLLGMMKKRPEYQGLPKVCQRIVDHLFKRHANPKNGIFVSQAKAAAYFGVTRQTMNGYLKIIVNSGVFTVEKRWREKGTKGGRTTNRYRLNTAPLYPPKATEPDTTPDTTPDITPDTTPDSRSFTEGSVAEGRVSKETQSEGATGVQSSTMPPDGLTDSAKGLIESPDRTPLTRTAKKYSRRKYDPFARLSGISPGEPPWRG